jgi:hypothetical protein
LAATDHDLDVGQPLGLVPENRFELEGIVGAECDGELLQPEADRADQQDVIAASDGVEHEPSPLGSSLDSMAIAEDRFRERDRRAGGVPN